MALRLAIRASGLPYTRSHTALVSNIGRVGWRRHLATVASATPSAVNNPVSKELANAAINDAVGTSTLPASWYRSDKLNELEKRAIYSNSWFMTTVTTEFKKPGDYRVYEFAGYSIFLVMDRDGQIRGFHNVCRHRAYPLRTQASGCSGVISCGYHAWTFSLTGDLIKAPSFDGVPGFNKSKNGLFPVHVHITRSGCIFVNLEASETPSTSFQDFFPRLEELLDGFDFTKYEFRHRVEVIGNYNWKTRIDGFQECYHCSVAHPGLAKTFDIKNYSLSNQLNYSQHLAQPSSDSIKDAYGNTDALFIYLYPSGAINCFKHGWQRSFTSPIDGGRTKVSKEYYVDPNLSEEEKENFVRSFSQVFQEDHALCEQTQKSLDAGVYTRGTLHPSHESGVLAYQARTKHLVLEHAALEESVGREVNPASRVNNVATSAELSEVDTLCSKLERREW